jgi:hypothetical protein
MERMRGLAQQSSSSSTELAASAEQMSKMSAGVLTMMDRFKLGQRESLVDLVGIEPTTSSMP